jgi:hypothetical protein
MGSAENGRVGDRGFVSWGAKIVSVYVDSYMAEYGRMKMSHMIADSLEELHEMAVKLRIRRWFQVKASFPHYDVCKAKREQAIRLGAIPVDKYQFVAKMREIRGRKAMA